MTAPTPAQVLCKAIGVSQVTLETGASVGVAFAYGPTKTCLMFSEVKTPVARLASHEDTCILDAVHVHNRVLQETVSIQVIGAYKYLGCILTSERSPKTEMMFRRAQAMGVVRPLQHRFFSAKAFFDLGVRRYLLRSLAISKWMCCAHFVCQSPQTHLGHRVCFLVASAVSSSADFTEVGTRIRDIACCQCTVASVDDGILACHFSAASFRFRACYHVLVRTGELGA